MSAASYDVLIKLLMIGDSATGKTSLLLRFAEDNFTPSFVTTIGIDFKIKTINVDGKRIKLQVWDTAGQERFRTITTAYYRGAMGIVLVYDVTDESSFHSVRNWFRNIDQHASADVEKVLVGNKCDKTNEKVIEHLTGQSLADEYGVKFYETSALDGTNVEAVFLDLAKVISKKIVTRPRNTDMPRTAASVVIPTRSSNSTTCCS